MAVDEGLAVSAGRHRKGRAAVLVGRAASGCPVARAARPAPGRLQGVNNYIDRAHRSPSTKRWAVASSSRAPAADKFMSALATKAKTMRR